MPARVLVGRHEDRTAATRDDRNGTMTGGDTVDERRQRPARFVGADGRRRSPTLTQDGGTLPSPRGKPTAPPCTQEC